MHGGTCAIQIKGEDWLWFGDDDIFSKDNPAIHGFHIVWQNQDLYSDYKDPKEYDRSMVRNDSKMVSFNVEASFKGQKALTFMKRQGYEFVPSKVLVENYEIAYASIETVPGSIQQNGGRKTTVGLTGIYASKGTVAITTKTKPIYYKIEYNPITDTKYVNEAYIDYLKYVPKSNFTYRLLKFIRLSEMSRGIHRHQKEINYNLFPQLNDEDN